MKRRALTTQSPVGWGELAHECYQRKLKCGATLVGLHTFHPISTIGIAIPFGSCHDPPQYPGTAHKLEHMVFRHEKDQVLTRDTMLLTDRGGTCNALTKIGYTMYFRTMMPQDVPKSVEYLTRLVTRRPDFSNEELKNETADIKQEIGRDHDNPVIYISDLLVRLMYAPPFGSSITGSVENVERIGMDVLQRFWDEKYGPQNFVVFYIGKHYPVNDLVNMLNDNLRFRQAENPPEHLQATMQTRHVIEKRRDIEQSQFGFGAHLPGPTERASRAIELMEYMVSNKEDGELFKRVREGLAYSIAMMTEFGRGFSYDSIVVGHAPGNERKILRSIEDSLRIVRTINPKKLGEWKEKFMNASFVEWAQLSMESWLDWAADFYFSGRGVDKFQSFDDTVSSVTMEDINMVAKIARYSTARLVPSR